MSEVQAPKIVVVDDDHELLRLITMLLRRLGAQSQTFFDGREAMLFLQTHTPDLIILDLMMPEINGIQILQHLRADDRFDQVPILILSAKVDPDSIREGLDNGADSYITKPYIATSLIDRVRLLLSTGRRGGSRPASEPSPDLN